MTDANTNQDRAIGYVGELGAKMPCRVATMINIILEGEQTVNGVALIENDIALVNGQDDLTENGVYIVSSGEWQRAVWFNNQLDAVPGTLVFTVEGSVKANSLWQTQCNDNPIIFGTSEITFRFFATTGTGNFLVDSNNLSDVISASISRINLGLQIGVNIQAYNAALAALAALDATPGYLVQTALNTFVRRNIVAADSSIIVSDGDAVGGNTSLAVNSISSFSATQAQQEAGTSLTAFVSPGRQQYHPSACKAWVSFTTVTTTAINASYNISSLTDNGTGDTTINFTIPFSTANYAFACCGGTSNGRWNMLYDGGTYSDNDQSGGQTASSFRTIFAEGTGAAADNTRQSLIFFGDQS